MQKTLFIKLSIIAGLCLLFAIGLSMLHSLVSERQYYAKNVVSQIAEQHVHPQKLITPFIVVPKKLTPACQWQLMDASNPASTTNPQVNNPSTSSDNKKCPDISYAVQPFFAEQTESVQDFNISTDTYQRGIYQATSFEGTVQFNQSFKIIDPYAHNKDDDNEQSNQTQAQFSQSNQSSTNLNTGNSNPRATQNTSQPANAHYQQSYQDTHDTLWSDAKLILPISDLRGVSSLPTVRIGNETLKTRYPETPIIEGLSYVEVNLPQKLTQKLEQHSTQHLPNFSTNLSEQNSSTKSVAIDWQINLPLAGVSHVLTVPTGQNFAMSMHGNWHAPNFIGDALPNSKELNDNNFTAKWQNHYLTVANNQLISQCFTGDDCHLQAKTHLNDAQITTTFNDYYDPNMVSDSTHGLTSFGTSFAEPNNVYLQTERTMKYALLLILVSFGTFFLFEVIKSSRIHPIQYLLVGSALLVFYVLLLPLAEQIPFWQAYAISGVACVGLIGFYAYYVLGSLKRAGLFTALLGGLYAGFYGILTTEEFNLLLGAAFCFVLLTSVMVLTRKINWYEVA